MSVLRRGTGGILGDAMGLGKTVQTGEAQSKGGEHTCGPSVSAYPGKGTVFGARYYCLLYLVRYIAYGARQY